MTDPLITHFEALDALLCAEATEASPIGWLWFRLVTEPAYLQECLARIGVS
jgi:hypothetical protein